MRWNVSIWWIFAIDKSASFPVDKRNASFWRERLHSRGDVILLDEPFTGVDVKTEAKIISLLRELRAEGKNDACLNAQSRIRHDILRLYGHGQRHRPGKRADRHHFYSREPWSWLLAAYCAMSHLTARKKALLLTMNALLWHIDRQRCRGKKDERATGTLQL